VALRLGLAMTAIQFSIGALNDLVDAAHDRGRRPLKPVAEGLVRPGTAMVVVGVTAAIGLGLAAASGPATVAVAVLGGACGYAYDLRLSRTPLSWAPLALALPLVPVFAWVGASGSLARELVALVPIGILGGAALAIGNALVDVEADRAAGRPSVAVWLGREVASRVHAASLGLATLLALLSAPLAASPAAAIMAVAGVAGLGIGGALVLTTPRSSGPSASRVGWQLEALGAAVLGIGWVAAQLAVRTGGR